MMCRDCDFVHHLGSCCSHACVILARFTIASTATESVFPVGASENALNKREQLLKDLWQKSGLSGLHLGPPSAKTIKEPVHSNLISSQLSLLPASRWHKGASGMCDKGGHAALTSWCKQDACVKTTCINPKSGSLSTEGQVRCVCRVEFPTRWMPVMPPTCYDSVETEFWVLVSPQPMPAT